MKAYLALNTAMGLCSKPSLRDYWSKYWLTRTPFPDIMSRYRYERLSCFLHYANNGDQVQRYDEGYDPLFKIKPLLNTVEPLYETVYVSGRNMSIDETIVKYKGRVFFRQYLPSKLTRWGIKKYVLCESKTGYHTHTHTHIRLKALYPGLPG